MKAKRMRMRMGSIVIPHTTQTASEGEEYYEDDESEEPQVIPTAMGSFGSNHN